MRFVDVRIGILALLFSALVNAKQINQWEFDSDDDGIIIYSREHKEGLVEISAQMFTPTSYGAFLTLLEDSENVPNWINNASHSRVLNQISVNENIVYTQFSAPWPVKDRDMVTYSRYWLDDLGFNIIIQDAPKDALAQQDEYIRIHSVEARWTLQKLNDGTTSIQYRAFANAGGLLPTWLMNRLSKESARTTFNNLRQQLPNYQQHTHPNIKE